MRIQRTACLAAAGLLGAVILAGSARAAAAQAADADTSSGYLDRLQEADQEGYSPELFQSNPAARDSALAALDSLGFEGYRAQQRSHIRPWDFDLTPAGKLLAHGTSSLLVTPRASESP